MVNDKIKEDDTLSNREVDNELNLPWGLLLRCLVMQTITMKCMMISKVYV